MIKTVADQVAKHNMGHKVDLENAERTILIELYKVGRLFYRPYQDRADVSQNTIGIGVVEDYDRYKKVEPHFAYILAYILSSIVQSMAGRRTCGPQLRSKPRQIARTVCITEQECETKVLARTQSSIYGPDRRKTVPS